MNSYTKAMKNYAVFSGRSSRSDYWLFILFYLIFYVICSVLDAVLGTYVSGGLGMITLLFSLAHLVPSIAALVRRLHDTDRSGWWALLAFVPLVGLIIILVFTCQASQETDNRFGPNPLPFGGTSPGLGGVVA